MLMFSLTFIYIAERQTTQAEEDVRRALLVRGDIQSVHTQLAEAAASVRGYLQTRQEDFLPGYLNAQTQIGAALDRLHTNVRDEQMREHLKAITLLIENKVDGLEMLHSLNQEGKVTIAAILMENKFILDELRSHLNTMREREDAVLAERTAVASENRERLFWATILAAGSGLLGALLAIWILCKGIVARVQQVQGNAQRLVQGHPLLPQPPENDEVGQLGTRLMEASQLLAKREQALRENEEHLQLLTEGAKEYGIFALDTKGNVITWNTGAERIKGYSEQEILGQHFSLFYPPEECPRHPDMALSEATLKGHYTEEGWRCRKDGSRFLASVVITAQYDSSNALRGFSKITRDITDRRAAEMALGTAREEVERASRAKSEFLSRMKVMVFNTDDDTDHMDAAISAGAVGYLPREACRDEVLAGLQPVASGAKTLSNAPLPRLPESNSQRTLMTEALTPRECQVLGLVASGCSNREIGEKLGITTGTAKSHVEKVIAKLGAADRTQAAVRGLALGLVNQTSGDWR
ncbi:PAS domain S-box protein [Pseudomonas cichorii]|nr:PAS domain S-box protein [Pseudomonas cichorii]